MSWSKIAAVGGWSTVFPLKSVGIEVFPTEDIEDVGKFIRHIARSREYGIIFVEESLYDEIADVRAEFADSDLPAIILIPSVSGSEGLGTSIIRETLKRAAGRDIMAEE
ncbi:MAG TPA: hypothetical protein ENG11_04935 [candidate division Zixibacteria bacterium]|nr:hypothetical protein [candidate division Zixibacteria bacterium]